MALKQMDMDRETGIPELKEVNLLRIINHPNIIKVFDYQRVI